MGESYTYTAKYKFPLLRIRILRPEDGLQHGRIRMRFLAVGAGGGGASGWAGLKQNGGQRLVIDAAFHFKKSASKDGLEDSKKWG